MAHFAKIDENNIVTRVERISDSIITDSNGVEQENLGVEFLRKIYNEPNAKWIQTSYNSSCGKYYKPGLPRTDENLDPDQSKVFRKTYAGIGYSYLPDVDAFKQNQPFNSWTFNEQKWLWEAPVSYPEDGQFYNWDEETLSWILVTPTE